MKKLKDKKSLLQLLEKESVRDSLVVLLKVNFDKYNWRGNIATPPGSILEKTIEIIRTTTDIPLEIPFFTALSFISAYLNKKGVVIESHMGTIRPDIWTVVLAPSGSSKSTTLRAFKRAVQDSNDIIFMPESASSAQFVIDLKNNNYGLLIKDEHAQHLRAMKEQSYLAEQKGYYLLAYDGQTIERRTKRDITIIENPSLTILGFNVDETFSEYLSAEDILDGFAQRFSYIIAKKDPARTIIDSPDYDILSIEKVIKDEWNELKTVKINNSYTLSNKAIEAFRSGFRELYKIDIPDSYYRRALFKAIKYSLLYHVILRKENTEIDDQDMSWALRLTFLHLKDGKELLGTKDISELEKIIRTSERIQKNFAKKGKTLLPRDLIAYNRKIESIPQAKAILEMLRQMTVVDKPKKDKKMSANDTPQNSRQRYKVIDFAGNLPKNEISANEKNG